MRRHEHLGLFRTGLAERNQVGLFKQACRPLIGGQVLVGIETRRPVTGKMLAARNDAGRAEAAGPGRTPGLLPAAAGSKTPDRQ